VVFFIARGKPGKEKNMAVETKTKNIKSIEVQEMCRTMTQSQIAAHYGITPSALWKWAHRHNVIITKVTDWEIAEGIWNKTPKQLASEYNVCLNTIYNRLKRMGICTKQDGQK